MYIRVYMIMRWIYQIFFVFPMYARARASKIRFVSVTQRVDLPTYFPKKQNQYKSKGRRCYL